jgi:hypothetical protein
MLKRDIGRQTHPSVLAAARLNMRIERKAAAAPDSFGAHPFHLLT